MPSALSRTFGLAPVLLSSLREVARATASSIAAEAVVVGMLASRDRAAPRERARLGTLRRRVTGGASRWALLPLAPRLLAHVAARASDQDPERESVADQAAWLLERLAGVPDAAGTSARPGSLGIRASAGAALATLETATEPRHLHAAMAALHDALDLDASLAASCADALPRLVSLSRDEAACADGAHEDDAHVACAALMLVGRLGPRATSAAAGLGERATSGWSHPCVREAAARALGALKTPEARRASARAEAVIQARLAWEPKAIDRAILTILAES